MSKRRELRLGELCSLIADSEHKTAPKDPSGPHPLIRTTDLGVARVSLRTAQRVNAATHHQWTRRGVPQEGDLILAREAPVGGLCRVPARVAPVLGQRTVLLRPHSSMVDGQFLMYRLAAPDLQARMIEMSTGATVPHLNMSDIRAFAISDLPAVVDQRRVASVLAAFDQLVEINQRRIELLEDLSRSLYREWFVDFRFPGHEGVGLVNSELGFIPEGWETRPLGDLAALRYGKSLPSSHRRTGTVAVVGSAGIIGSHDEALVEGPGVVVGRKGNVGAVWWVETDFHPIDTAYYVESDLPLEFLYWHLQTLNLIDSHAAVPGLSRDQARALTVVAPDPDIAWQFADADRSVRASIALLRSQNHSLAATRDLLLPRLVTGRLDISDVDLGELLPAEAA